MMQDKRKFAGKVVLPRFSIESHLVVSGRTYQFSILEHSMATREILHLVWGVYKGKIKEFRDIVPLQPERIILHELAALMQCYIKQESDPAEGEVTCKRMVWEVYGRLMQSEKASDAIAIMKRDYVALELLIINLVDKDEPDTLNAEEVEVVKKLWELAKIDRFVPNRDGAIEGIRAILYMQRARKLVNDLFSQMLSEEQGKEFGVLLPLQQENDAVAVFTVGGSASGKTSSLRKTLAVIEEIYGIEYEDMAHHNLDRLRSVLLDTIPGTFNYDSLTVDEARLLKEREMQLISQAWTQGTHVPHELHDSTQILARDFLWAATHRKAVVVCLVSTDFETALHRSFSRGQEEHRYVSLAGLLSNHKAGVISLIQALNQDRIKGTNTTVLMYDNNGPKGSQPTLFCTINAQDGIIFIHNEDMLKLWIKKCRLNTTIEEPKEYKPEHDMEIDLYIGNEITVEAYLEPLTIRGYSITYLPISELTPEQTRVVTNYNLFQPEVISLINVYTKVPDSLKTSLDSVFRTNVDLIRAGDFVKTLQELRRLYFGYHPDKHNGKIQPGYHELNKIIEILKNSDKSENQSEILAILDKTMNPSSKGPD